MLGENGAMALPLADRRDPALAKRAASSVALIALALVSLGLGGWAFAALVAVATVAMSMEWARLAPTDDGRPLLALLVGTPPLLAIAAGTLGNGKAAIIVLAIGAALAAGISALSRRPHADHAGLGVIYLGLPTLALVWLVGQTEGGAPHVLWLFLVVWATDICAYLTGRHFGGPKLAPSISPGKTWSGLAGGIAGAVAIGSLASAAVNLGGIGAGLFGGALAIVSQLGDLYESAMKRRAGRKDSGHLIPGHGGVLDRLDGLLWAAPVYALFVLVTPFGLPR